MNINAMVVSQLRKRREKVAAELSGIDAALTAFGGSVKSSAPVRTRTRKKTRTLGQIAAIEKAQAARKASLAAKKADAGTAAEETPVQKARRERLERQGGDTEHALSKGASLAEAAG